MKLEKIAEIVSGQLLGNGNVEIRGVAPFNKAGAGDLAFVLDEGFLAPALESQAAALIVPAKVTSAAKPAISVKNTRLALAKILPHFFTSPGLKLGTVHPLAFVAASATLGQRVTIYPFAYVGEGCVIGDDTIIYSSATIFDGATLGQRVIVHSGVRIGEDGFGFVWNGQKHEKIMQVGSVVIEDDVEIYPNSCVARGTLGETRIGAGTKIDSLTQIAHNCDIGKDCILTSLVGLAGSVTLKDNITVGGMAGFLDHITVGENSIILAKAGVTKDLPPNSMVSGFPARPHLDELKQQAALNRLAKK